MSASSSLSESVVEQVARPLPWQITVCLSFALAVLIAGCGKEPAKPWEKVYPVKGSVVFKGKPLAGAQLTLIPQDNTFPSSVRPSATSKDDGTFVLGTYSAGDGAPAGTYKVVAVHYPVVGSKDNPSAGPNDLPAKFARPETTTLTVEVGPSETELQPLTIK